MAASSIFYNGRMISTPGSYSEVDASSLEPIGLGAVGIVAVLGEAEGGRPASTITEVKDIAQIKPGKASALFRSGTLLEVGPMLASPAKDADIQAGAAVMVPLKINPATQSAAVLTNAQGDALDLVSNDYGEFTKQVSVSLATGDTQGKRLVITFEDITEAVDDLGGDDLFTLQYTAGASDWAAMTAQVLAGGLIECNGSKTAGGADGDFTQPISAIAMEVVSTDAGDTTQTVEVVGIDDGGAALTKSVTLTGTVAVSLGADLFDVVTALKRIGTAAGTVTLRAASAGATVATLVTGGSEASKGITAMSPGYAQGVVTLVSSGASTQKVVLVGTSLAGAVQAEVVTLTGTVSVDTTASFGSLLKITTGDVEAAQTLTATALVAKTSTAHNTLQKVADFFNTKKLGAAGFDLTLATGQTRFDPDNLDVQVAAVDIFDPAEPGFKADLYAIMAWINQNSQYVTANRSTGASGGAPDNTSSPIFLAGGGEGTSSFSHWQGALNLLKQLRVNSVVVMTADPAVHAALDAHCAYMCGIGRSERDGFVGLMNATFDDVATKDEAKAQIVNLNTRHLRAWAQPIERYNSEGERTEYAAPFGAAILAGMQAGSPVGTSLTYKYMNVLAIRQHSSWNPTDDSKEMIDAGLAFAENVDGVGRRVVRNITTHLTTSNLAYTEGSVNETVNYAAFNFRTNMEYAVGRKGFSGTINAGLGIAIGTLGLLVDEEILVAYRSLDIETALDVMEVSCEIAPIIPINFVKNNLHLVTIRQSAA